VDNIVDSLEHCKMWLSEVTAENGTDFAVFLVGLKCDMFVRSIASIE
jgi:hypothetical protein